MERSDTTTAPTPEKNSQNTANGGAGAAICSTPSAWGRLRRVVCSGFTGEQPVEEVVLCEADSVVLGRRGSGVKVLTADKRISGQHVCISRVDEGRSFTIKDTSSNGVSVNGVPLPPKEEDKAVALEPGDEIAVLPTLTYIFQRVGTAPLPHSSGSGASVASASDAAQHDKMKEELECAICLSIMHQPVTAVPCAHHFCGACLTSHLAAGRDECPLCRRPITSATADHGLNSIISTFLSNDGGTSSLGTAGPPSRTATVDDRLWKGHTTVAALLAPHLASAAHDDPSDSRSEQSDSEESVGQYCICSEGPCTDVPGGDGGGDGGLPPCVDGRHLECAACCELYPRSDKQSAPEPPPQECGLCKRTYCDAYRQASGGGHCPGGVLVRGSDFSPSAVSAASFAGNRIEAGFLREAIALQGVSVRSVWLSMLETVGREWHWPPQPDRPPAATTKRKRTDSDASDDESGAGRDDGGAGASGATNTSTGDRDSSGCVVSAELYACGGCWSRVFNEAMYRYRVALTDADLPAAARGRPDCWYGRNCRTQTHNSSHATRLNHACAQTRFR